jgi:CheY-like chemotaxis protein
LVPLSPLFARLVVFTASAGSSPSLSNDSTGAFEALSRRADGDEGSASGRSFSSRQLEPIRLAMPAPRVLVIDDDEAVRLTFSHVLKLEGYSVQVAATAVEALGSVEHERPDAILLDLKMPFINGVGFLYRLRQDPANRDIAVAVITGVPALDDATVTDLRALSALVCYKPLSIEDIQEVARTLLTRERSETAPSPTEC